MNPHIMLANRKTWPILIAQPEEYLRSNIVFSSKKTALTIANIVLSSLIRTTFL